MLCLGPPPQFLKKFETLNHVLENLPLLIVGPEKWGGQCHTNSMQPPSPPFVHVLQPWTHVQKDMEFALEGPGAVFTILTQNLDLVDIVVQKQQCHGEQ